VGLFFHWGRPVAGCAPGGDTIAATIRLWMTNISGKRRRLQAFCARQGIPVIETQARDRKHELAQLRLLACAGLFWTIFMFTLTFTDYLSRHY
jgi:hypothetical protein